MGSNPLTSAISQMQYVEQLEVYNYLGGLITLYNTGMLTVVTPRRGTITYAHQYDAQLYDDYVTMLQHYMVSKQISVLLKKPFNDRSNSVVVQGANFSRLHLPK